MNAGLTAMCTKKDVKFANNDPYFVFSDGSINEGYIETDGIHLTRSGVNRLAKTIGVKPKDTTTDVYRSREKKDGSTDYRGHQKEEHSGHETTANSTVDRQREARCYFCFERGHVNGNCHHGREVKCHNCHKLGHKAKFCVEA